MQLWIYCLTRLLGVCIAFVLLPAVGDAEILYRVTPSVKGDYFTVEMEFAVSIPTVELQMPSWAFTYTLKNGWTTLHDVTATDESGSPLSVSQPRGDTWSIVTAGHKRIRVRYDRPITRARFDSDQTASDTKALHYGGPSVYLYIVGRKAEPCLLEFAVPDTWKVAVSLKEESKRGGHLTFRATDYDVLADSPVTMGDYLEERYRERGKEHLITLRGPARDRVNRQTTLQMCRFVTQIETDFFHGAPYDRYVWHFWVYDGNDLAGGTEHADSTEMHLTAAEGPDALQGMAHEFFHLWNVKRIRPKALGPFDYTRLPRTGALWWLEGVTDYYSMLLPLHYGAWGRDRFLANALRQVREMRSNPARLEVSPYDASYRIPDAKNDAGSGYRVNYYPTGWVLGMLFDLELRARSNGRRSLDDVVHALWDLCKDDQPGFEEDEIRRQLIRFGGESLGALYDQWVLKPGELPVEQQLAKVGLQIVEQDKGVNGRPGVIDERSDITPAQRRLCESWLKTRTSGSRYQPITLPPMTQPTVSLRPDRPVTQRIVNTKVPEMVLIPAGDFLMGSNDGDDEEKPVHRVHLSAYSISKTPVTVAQYQAFCLDTRRQMPPAPDFNQNWNHQNHPIVNVGWKDADAYCQWLSNKMGKAYRLPTEAQWERAARGGKEGTFPWGDAFDLARLWCSQSKQGDAGGTAAVGSFPPNDFGLYDMVGNVWQLCADYYDKDFYSTQQAATPDPENKTMSEARVVRGGSWGNVNPVNFRCANRNSWQSDHKDEYGGFRVAFTPP